MEIEVEKTPADSDNADGSNRFSHKRIFVIDDDAIIIEFVTQLLEVAGFTDIHGFIQSTEAIELLRFVRPDLIITDIHMPELGGTFLAKMVMEFPHINRVPMLAMTADDSLETFEKARRNGISDVILKPIDDRIFVQKINAAFEQIEKNQRQLGAALAHNALKKSAKSGKPYKKFAH